MAEEPSAAPPERHRPFGVVVIAGILLLLAGLSASALLGFREALPGTGTAALVEGLGDFAPVIGVITLFGVLAAIGLWLLRRWAWYWAMTWTGLALAYQILIFVSGRPNYLYMAIYVVCAFYLNQRDVRGLFLSARSETPTVTLEHDGSGPS